MNNMSLTILKLSRQIIIYIILFFSIIHGQLSDIGLKIAGSAFLENHSYQFLFRLSNEAGGRLAGAYSNEKALKILSEELEKGGWEVKFEHFVMPGWRRGEDKVTLQTKPPQEIPAVALGYVAATPLFEGELTYANQGYPDDYEKINAAGKIVMVHSENVEGRSPLYRCEAIEIAAEYGAKAILFQHKISGYIQHAGTGSFQGKPTHIPAFSISKEDGERLKKLLEISFPVILQIQVKSECLEINTSNVLVTLPGKTKKKIVLGAHIDSWDLGQGSIDNGLGTAILFEVSRLLKTYSPENYYTIEFVWFNGEELGLFGSKNYVNQTKTHDIITMINMDMTGSPTGFNAMGFDEYIPLLKQLVVELNGFDLYKEVVSKPWTNSDHMPFMFQGIPVITLQAKLDQEMIDSYHSQQDTFDKVNKRYLSESAAVITLLVRKLANDANFSHPKKNKDEIKHILEKFHIDERLKKQKEWIFE
jgi:Iap family predicted aminopeptidase